MKKIGHNMKSTSFIHETKHIYNIYGVKMLLRDFIDVFQSTFQNGRDGSQEEITMEKKKDGIYKLILQKSLNPYNPGVFLLIICLSAWSWDDL
jgi:hypothetical protein